MFNFKGFSLHHRQSALKIGTDSVLLASVIPPSKPETLLDIGCGCGVITFCLAYKCSFYGLEKKCHVVGIDSDLPSIEECRENEKIFPKNSLLTFNFYHTSLQQFQNISPLIFDLIVANPPFFQNALKPENIQRQNSKHADHNLSFEELKEGVLTLLSQTGNFYLILPPTEQLFFDQIAANSLFPQKRWEIFPSPKKPSNRIITEYSRTQPERIIFKELYIRDIYGKHTKEYGKITELFYLDK
ncbi:MAG: methyltransferase [Bacteroidales bacterium]|jgi:tRNA1Val (adenine37-N6)-methyltransferase|nr:methyltransferase [Bacteroidales bacterium]